VDDVKEKELFDEIKSKYDRQTTPYYAASRLWVDAIIDPRKTRDFISTAIEAANNAPVEKFNVGVMQV
jgi:acetyl-CoA carboxylase carboxyltransferase component